MEVRAGGVAGLADLTQLFAAVHSLPCADSDPRQMRVEVADAVGLHDHLLAVGRAPDVPAGGDDAPATGCLHARADRGGVVVAGVVAGGPVSLHSKRSGDRVSRAGALGSAELALRGALLHRAWAASREQDER